MAKSKRRLFYDVFRPTLEHLGFHYHSKGLFYKYNDDQGWFLGINLVSPSMGDAFDINISCLPYTTGKLNLDDLLETSPFTMRRITNMVDWDAPGKATFEQCLHWFNKLLFDRINRISMLEDAINFSVWIKKCSLLDFTFGQSGKYLLPEIYAYASIGKYREACSLTNYYVMGCEYALNVVKKNIDTSIKYNLCDVEWHRAQLCSCEKELAYAKLISSELRTGNCESITQTVNRLVEEMQSSIAQYFGGDIDTGAH